MSKAESRDPGCWEPERYLKFRRERERPFDDVLRMIEPRREMRVLDLGCGTGALTARLHRALGARETLGIDASEAMLARAPSGIPGLRFERRRIEEVIAGGGSWDLIVSNSALHWLDDHERLFAELSSLLSGGGQLAAQMPSNHDYPTHRASAELAKQPPFRDALGGYVQRYGVLAPEAYGRLLHRLAFADQRVRPEVYGHVLQSRSEVVEWVRGSHLTDYEARLPPDLWERFLGTYRDRLMRSLPDERPFYFPMKRILVWAERASGET